MWITIVVRVVVVDCSAFLHAFIGTSRIPCSFAWLFLPFWHFVNRFPLRAKWVIESAKNKTNIREKSRHVADKVISNKCQRQTALISTPCPFVLHGKHAATHRYMYMYVHIYTYTCAHIKMCICVYVGNCYRPHKSMIKSIKALIESERERAGVSER